MEVSAEAPRRLLATEDDLGCIELLRETETLVRRGPSLLRFLELAASDEVESGTSAITSDANA